MSASKASAQLIHSLQLLQQSRHLGVVTCSVERVLTANDAYLKMVGFTRAEMNSGKLDWRAITPPESLARAEQAIRELREQGACIPFEKEYILRDGTHVPVLVGAVRYSSEPLEWVCWITDLRAQKERARAEETSRKLQLELEAELRGADLIYGISTRLLSKQSIAELLSGILDAAIELTEADFGTIQVADGQTLRIATQRCFSPFFLRFFDEVSADTVTASGVALKHGSRVVVEDVRTDQLFGDHPGREVLLAEGVRSVQSTPLIGASGEIYGMLSTHFRAPGRPSERALRFLDLLASRAGQVLEGVQYAEARRRAELLRASGQLANALAHEINNPVQALTNIMTLLSEHEAVLPEAQSLVQSASEQLKRVSETVRKILTVDFGQAPSAPKLTKLIEHMREEGRLGEQSERKSAG